MVLNGFNLKAIRCSVTSGATTGGEATLAGITLQDQLICVHHLDGGGAGTFNAVLYEGGAGEATISADGKLKTPVTDTSAGDLLVWWYDVSADEGPQEL